MIKVQTVKPQYYIEKLGFFQWQEYLQNNLRRRLRIRKVCNYLIVKIRTVRRILNEGEKLKYVI